MLVVRVLRSFRVTGLTARRLACSTVVPRSSLCYARFARFCRRPRKLGSLLFLASLVAGSLRSPLDGRTSSTIFVGGFGRYGAYPRGVSRGYALRNTSEAGARLSMISLVGVHHFGLSGFVFASPHSRMGIRLGSGEGV